MTYYYFLFPFYFIMSLADIFCNGTAHIKSRGEENIRIEIPGFRARRWVVERTHSWINRFRRLLIRWEKKIENYLAMLHLASAWITFRAAGLFG
jgi:putative transposase